MICRLCFNEPEIEIIDIFDEQGIRLQIADIISKHFWFSPSRDDHISDKICCSCWTKVNNFHEFYCFVEEAQKKLVNIKQSLITKVETVETSVDIPFIIDNLKEEQLCTDDYDAELNDDWKFEDYSTDNVTEKKDPLDDLDNKIKQEILPNETEVISEDIQLSKRTKIPSKLIDNNESSTGHENRCNSPNTAQTSKTDSPKRKNKKRSPYKKSVKNEPQNPDSDDTESEKMARKKKVEEEDKFIAQFIQMNCNLCKQNFDTFNQLKSHFYKQHKTKSGYVVCCNKRLFSRTPLLQHINYHLNPDAFSCKICGKKFKNADNLKNHVKYRHELEKSQFITCDVCQKKFPNEGILKRHKLTHIQDDEKQFKCTKCEKFYLTESQLRFHIRYTHDRAYDIVCDICAKVFQFKHVLEKHRLEHAGIKEPKAQCQKCGSWFKNEMLLKRHLKRHEEALMGLKCDICGKGSPSICALKYHIKYSHKIERNFKCTLCEKAFKERKILREHVATHTGEILYTCSFCSHVFNSKANMYNHRKKHHPKEWEELKKQRITPVSESPSAVVSELNEKKSVTSKEP